MIQPHEAQVEKIQTITVLVGATLSILMGVLAYFYVPLARPVAFSFAAVMIVMSFLGFWTVRRLRQLRK